METTTPKDSTLVETTAAGDTSSNDRKLGDTVTKVNETTKKATGNLSKPIISSFVDLVDMCAHNCCGYCYVLELVDPVSRLGHVTILKSKSDESLSTGFSKLMSLSRFPPTTVYYDMKYTFIAKVATLYPRVVFTMQSHSSLMLKERSLFLKQLKMWIDAYGNHWLRGVSVVQAVTNTLNIE